MKRGYKFLDSNYLDDYHTSLIGASSYSSVACLCSHGLVTTGLSSQNEACQKMKKQRSISLNSKSENLYVEHLRFMSQKSSSHFLTSQAYRHLLT
ncbi:Alpha-glucosides permease MPH3 [Fusarium oxysporum f. sp. albedinis]|nr:Alpha-glucosides permease MPH3 [Fusarium oxysporum f. sp. albedinis]